VNATSVLCRPPKLCLYVCIKWKWNHTYVSF